MARGRHRHATHEGEERRDGERPRPPVDQLVPAQRRQRLVDALGVASRHGRDQVHLDLVAAVGQLAQREQLQQAAAVDRRPGSLGGHPEDAQGPEGRVTSLTRLSRCPSFSRLARR